MVSSGADVPGDRTNCSSGSAGVVPGGHPEDAAGHLVLEDHDCEDQRLRMVADGSLAAQQLGQAGELVQ